jgi:ribosome maturation protein Sdo1
MIKYYQYPTHEFAHIASMIIRHGEVQTRAETGRRKHFRDNKKFETDLRMHFLT